MDYRAVSLQKHYEWKGKLEVVGKPAVTNAEELSLAYTPGVAEPCVKIAENPELAYELTGRGNLVAVVTDGSAVLGLGNIGPSAAMPVMEGKCLLFKAFAGVDAVPICIDSQDVNDIVRTVKLLSKSFGGINLEDISAPRCFEIERQLIEQCDIPIFHDDQHGTAIVTLAGLINALKVVGKEASEVKCVITGVGAAGSATARLMIDYGFKDIIMVNSKGILGSFESQPNADLGSLALMTNPRKITGGLSEAIAGADVFIGVSGPGILTKEMAASMNEGAIIFAMANPTPEIMPDVAKAAGAAVIATGRSDFPNQINNVLAFPGVFRGALDARHRVITKEMKINAAKALAALVEEPRAEYIIPSPFDKRVAEAVAKAVRGK